MLATDEWKSCRLKLQKASVSASALATATMMVSTAMKYVVGYLPLGTDRKPMRTSAFR
jgi:hypothetical protein